MTPTDPTRRHHSLPALFGTSLRETTRLTCAEQAGKFIGLNARHFTLIAVHTKVALRRLDLRQLKLAAVVRRRTLRRNLRRWVLLLRILLRILLLWVLLRWILRRWVLLLGRRPVYCGCPNE